MLRATRVAAIEPDTGATLPAGYRLQMPAARDARGARPVLVHGSHRLEQRLIESSRSRLLETLAGSRDVTFVRSIGNVGDELIWAGTRRLLADVAYREVGIGELDGVSGHTVLLSGGGAWSQPYHELLPEILGALDASFERVVVLPSSFDLEVPSVRRALARTRGVVFAREPVSYRLISRVCRAQLACDCAFFFDFVSYRRGGYGELTAHRADRESPLWGEVYVVDSSGEERLLAAGVEGSHVAPGRLLKLVAGSGSTAELGGSVALPKSPSAPIDPIPRRRKTARCWRCRLETHRRSCAGE